MINIRIDENDLLNILMERVDFWTDGDENTTRYDLFKKMYKKQIDGGMFEGARYDIMAIVDNDIINWCSIIDKEDDNFNKILELYKNGNYDISCENVDYNFIESVDNEENPNYILVRC